MLNPYQNQNNTYNPYNSTLDSVSGVDLRAELKELFWDEEESTKLLYRRILFEDGFPKRCKCREDNRSNEPDRDIKCSICGGMGYYFQDYLVRGYVNHSQAYAQYLKVKPVGGAKTEYKTAYLQWNSLGNNIPNKLDRIYQLQQDLEGKLVSPLAISQAYEILSVDPYRLDNKGRMEYYRFRIISIVDESIFI